MTSNLVVDITKGTNQAYDFRIIILDQSNRFRLSKTVRLDLSEIDKIKICDQLDCLLSSSTSVA